MGLKSMSDSRQGRVTDATQAVLAGGHHSCGFQRDEATLETESPWVRNRISLFNSPSTPL